MRYILIYLIKFYWKITIYKKHKCIFRESCSRYVYRITEKEGFLSGIKALIQRYNQCRPGYLINFDKKGKLINVKLPDGSIADVQILSIESLIKN